MTNFIELTSKRVKKSGLFSPIMRKAFLTLIALFMAIPGFAQNIDVTGTVIDNTGEPLIGVTVLVAGTSNGAATDIDGNFSLKNVPSKGKLTFSYVGYTQQTVEVKGQKVINVTMSEDSQALEELVVVGYGQIKKSDLTGSVSTVDTEKLNAKGAPSVLENLQGSVPGVNITKSTGRSNGGIDIEIRGKSSINSDTKPLYVVDGVMTSDIDFLNPQDIERIDVLKDASSTAIYGSRATAGVVMITTKGGLNVNKNVKATVSYDGYYGISHAARMPDFMDGQEWYRYRILKFTEPVTTGAQPTYSLKPTSMGLGQALIQQVGADTTSPYVLKQMLANDQTWDWPGLVTKDGHQQNHYVAISGASETANYHFGLGYNDEDGLYEGDGQTTFSFKGSVDARVNRFLSGGFNMNLAQINNQYADDDAIAQAYRVNPFMQAYDEDGNIIHFPGNKATLGSDEHQFSDFINPLHRMMNSNHKRKTYRLLGNIYVQLDIIKGLRFKSTFSPTYSSYRDGLYSGYTNPETGKTYVDNDTHTAKVINYTAMGWTWDNMITFDRSFGDHSINAMALFSAMHSRNERYTWQASDVMEGSDWWNMGSGEFDKANSSSAYSEANMQSWALRANYSWKSRYMITGTVRWDGSSKFADGHRWGCFPSVAAAWNIAEEEFLQKSWLNNLKLRLSYGVTGNNAGIGNYATVVGVSGPVSYPFWDKYASGFYPAGIVDTDLMWEKSHEFNVGLDFGFLNNRITGTIDWYNKQSNDLLYKVELPLESGGGSMSTNVGKVRNRGIEIGLTTTNIDTRDWLWTTTFSFSKNINKVLEINGVSDRVVGSNATGNLFVGRPVNNVYAYAWDGIITDQDFIVPDHPIAIEKGYTPGQTVKMCDYYYDVYGATEGQPVIRDVNGDGKWDADDKVIFNGEPKWTGSVTSNLSYRLPKKGGSLDFSFSIFTKQGFKIASPFMGGDLLDYHDRGRGKLNMDYYIPAGMILDADGINPDGSFINPVYQTTTHYGKYPVVNAGNGDGLGTTLTPYNDSKVGARQVVDGSFWKVQNISLGYTFSKELIGKIGCKNLRLYVNITNPFVWTKYKGFDPEWAGAAGKNDGPSTITYQFGANITF